MKRFTKLLLAAAVLLQNRLMVTDAGAALTLPPISVVRSPTGVSVEHSTQLGVLYQLESSTGLDIWEPSGPARYGTGALLSIVVFVPPPPQGDPNPPPPWDAPARWISFFITPISTTQTVVGFHATGRFQRVLLTSSNFLTPNFHPRVAIRQNEGTPSNPSDDVILDCDFLLFGWSRDQLLFPRSDEDFPGISAPHKADLYRLIAARTALMAANQTAIANPLPVGPPLPPGPRHYYRLKASTLDSDGDGVYDSDEIAAGTNPYANPALNPFGSTGTTGNPTGLRCKPFWKRNLPQVTIQQKWRSASITIGEGNPKFGEVIAQMKRSGTVQNHTMAAPRTTGLAFPIPSRDQVRLNPRNEILRSWGFSPSILLEPGNASPEWSTWLPANNQPLHARYSCQQAPPNAELIPFGYWQWKLEGEERLFRITCSTSAPQDLIRHFLKVKRQRRWLGAEDMPEWTYEPTTVITMTIPQGSTVGGIADGATPRPVDLIFPSYSEKPSPGGADYVSKTTEIEEIYLPVEIQSPTRQASGTLLGKIGGLRQQIYAPELRIAKLFPGKDAADAIYSPIQSATPFAIVPEEDPDSYIIRVHDTSGVWQQLANPTAKPGIRITTTSQAPYAQFYSDQSTTNSALFQVDATSPAMAPGWLATKSMFLVSNRGDNIQPASGPIDGARNDLSRIVLPGGTVTVAFPGWQRSTTPIPADKIISFNLTVPIAAKATLDMKIFQDSPAVGASGNIPATQLEGVNEHFAQIGIVFDKTVDTPPVVLSAGLNSQIPYFYISNLSPSPLTRQVRDLARLAGRVTGNGVEPNVQYARNDSRLGILFCANQPVEVLNSSPGLSLPSFSLESSEQAFNGNLFHLYSTNSGHISGYNPRITAHEVGHLLTNKGHFGGPAYSGNNYQSLASTNERNYNLMTEGPWASVAWPSTHQRLSEEQESLIFTNGAVWLRNP